MTNDSPHFVVVEQPVADIPVPRNAVSLNVSILQREKPLYALFTDGVRLYSPNGSFQQRTLVGDKANFTIHNPESGAWQLMYVTDEFLPGARHVLHVVAAADVEKPAEPASE